MRKLVLSVLLVSAPGCVVVESGGPGPSSQKLEDQKRVEARIDEFVVRDGPPGDQPSWNLESLRPHQLAIVAAHFFDERPAWVLGAYDNGGGPNEPRAKWTVGHSLFSEFQRVFYPVS